MANNHQGSVSHAKKIIDEFSTVAKNHNINAGIKLQFRQLDSFIHDEFKKSDLKYVKRFNDTRLNKEDFKEIVDHIKERGLVTIATPFDNESLPWIEEMKISVVKIASCSIDDWPLLREVCKINKKIIISTAGASIKTLKKTYRLFKDHQRDFAFMHCVGEYPTAPDAADLNRIAVLKESFPDIEIGLSTHESPNSMSVASLAVAMGCRLIEKHVGVETETIKLNGYSNTPEQMSSVIKQVTMTLEAINGKSQIQHCALNALKRGIYLRESIPVGHIFLERDFYYALPVQDGCYNASQVESLVGKTSIVELAANAPIRPSDTQANLNQRTIADIKEKAINLLDVANIPLSGEEKIEISSHYGLENFFQFGALIIDKVNRDYCKKIIVVFPGQNHPSHHHIKKEETFELLYGDCCLVLNGKKIPMRAGSTVLISRGTEHSFSSKTGCVIEEISTTHIPGDSVYEDLKINTLRLSDRKIKIKLI